MFASCTNHANFVCCNTTLQVIPVRRVTREPADVRQENEKAWEWRVLILPMLGSGSQWTANEGQFGEYDYAGFDWLGF
jgi:hypothetical protein